MEQGNGFFVGQSGERGRDPLEFGDITFEHVQLVAPELKDTRRNVAEQGLSEIHHIGQFRKGHLGLHHPELHQVAACLGLLRAEGRSETIDLAQGRRRGLAVELTALGQVGLLVEIIGMEQRGGAFTGIRRENRRVRQNEPPLVKEIPAGPDDLMPNQ